MAPHVRPERTRTFKAFSALFTRKGPRFRMNDRMSLKAPLTLEGFIALLAFIRALSRVDLHVTLEIFHCLQTFTAFLTREGFLFTVAHRVLLETSRRVKLSATLRTSVLLRFCVNFHV